MGTPGDELVWGVDRAALDEAIGRFQGFLPLDEPIDAVAAVFERLGEFRPRREVEEDPSWKQVIPYVTVLSGERVLLLERLSTQGESRLHHLLSLGVGGHVNPEPPGEESLLVRGLRRELAEELEVDDPARYPPRLLGLINDDSTAVGQVHLGVSCAIECDRTLEVRERDRMRGRWLPLSELPPVTPRMETWSQLLLPTLDRLGSRGARAGPGSGG